MASQISSLTIVYSTVYSRRRSENISKLRVIGLCAGNSTVTGEFPAQRASNAEKNSIWWRRHGRWYILADIFCICSTKKWVNQFAMWSNIATKSRTDATSCYLLYYSRYRKKSFLIISTSHFNWYNCKRQDYAHRKGECSNKANKIQGVIILWDVEICANTYA